MRQPTCLSRCVSTMPPIAAAQRKQTQSVPLEGPKHRELITADLAFQPGRGHLSDAMVMAHGCPGSLDGIEDATVKLQELLVTHLRDEDEV